MIRRIVASLVPLLVAAPLTAQTMVGVRAGLSRSTFSEFLEEEFLEFETLGLATSEDPRMGVVAGIDVAFPVAAAVELRAGGAYAQKGYSVSFSAPEDSGSTSFESSTTFSSRPWRESDRRETARYRWASCSVRGSPLAFPAS